MFIASHPQLGRRRLMCAIRVSAFTAVIAVGPAVVTSPPARAEPSGLTVRTAKDIGPFRGKVYREVEAQLQGTAPGGAYAVPVTLAFPKQVSDHNGFAIVDIVNTITIGKDQFVLGGQPLPLARRHMGDDFLFGRGNVYVGVIWDKTAVEALGNGTIATAVDGYAILRDAATLVRNPSKYLPAEAGAAPASDNIIANGYPQTGNLLRGWYFDHMNRDTGTPAFNGGLVGGANGRCLDLHDMAFKTCAGALADGSKVIDLSPETDVEWGGDRRRANWTSPLIASRASFTPKQTNDIFSSLLRYRRVFSTTRCSRKVPARLLCTSSSSSIRTSTARISRRSLAPGRR
jgi:hypothetical protein